MTETSTSNDIESSDQAQEGAKDVVAPRPVRKSFPSRSDKEAYAAWLEQLEHPDRSNCRA